MSTPEQSREELAAALSVRKDLGPEYEDAVVDGFLDRMDAAIASRVDARVAERLEGDKKSAKDSKKNTKDSGDSNINPGVIALASMGMGIPISGIAGGTGGIGGLVVAWAGIAGVNAAYNWGRRRSS